MSPYVGIVVLDAIYLAVGAATLFGLGIARTARALALHAGLALLVGWAVLGTVASLLLIAGLAAAVWQIVLAAALLTAAAPALGRRIDARPARLVGDASGWQTWFTSFANSDYPPFAPAVESLAFRFAGEVRTDVLPMQHWILAVGFFGALAVLLARRVPPWILWPSLALLALMPSFTRLVGSSLADEPLSMAVALAGVCGALWLLEDDPRLAAVAGVFLVAATLLKNEGLLYAVLLAVLLGVLARRRRVRVPLALLAAVVLAIVPWKLWLSANDIAGTKSYDPADLLRPGYLADRSDRLWTALNDVPAYFLSWDAWLVAVPLALALAFALLRRRPELGAFVLGAVGIAFGGNLVVYWVSREPIHWYITTTADRTSATAAVLSAAFVPLLAAESLRPRHDRAG